MRTHDTNGNEPRDLLVGAAAGLLAMATTGASDALLDRLVSPQEKRRERRVREGSPHDIAGPRFGSKLLRRSLSDREEDRARTAFSVGYGIGWGVVYALLRRRFPQMSRMMGLPFALPFFAACDGVLAPLMGLTPSLHKIPGQLNAKELANHVVWTASTEAVHRLRERVMR